MNKKLLDHVLLRLPRCRLGDKIVSWCHFFQAHKRRPRRVNGSLNDALFYIKTSDEILDPLRVYVTDKHFLKEYVRAKLGESYNVPTLALLDATRALGFEYPERCVIKPTHLSGKAMYRYVGEPYKIKTLWNWLNTNYYDHTREANYRYLRPQIIVEPFIFDAPNPADYHLHNYKIFCLRGVPKLIQVTFDRRVVRGKNFYTIDWKPVPITLHYPQGPGIKKPDNLEQMLAVASTLSRDFSLIRVDLYTNDRQVLVGELTNLHGSGHSRFGSRQEEEIFKEIVFGPKGFCALDF